MKFDDYLKLHDCTPLKQTEQSLTFMVIKDGTKTVAKKYPSSFDRAREELAYAYISSTGLLNIPRVIIKEEDFIEIEFLQQVAIPSSRETIEEISKIYIGTLNDSKPKGYFPTIDLTKDKLFRRLEYFPYELEKRGSLDKNFIEKCEHFTDETFRMPDDYCLAHGDLKSSHAIKTENGIFFIDLALVSVANPWYDLAFLYMERKDKKYAFDELCKDSFEILRKDFDVNRGDVKEYLRSAIFYRCFYNVGFAARHRPDKTLKRTLHELSEILEH